MSIFDSNIFQNPVPRRYADYTTNINITDVPFAESNTLNIPLEGRTKPVTDIREIAPTGSTKSVVAQGIANAALRNQFDFNKSFSTLVQGSGQPNIRDPNQTYDYSGYKLGNPTPGITGMGKEVWEGLKTIYGGHAPNIIANTLGDYTTNYTPKLDPNHPEVMSIYDEYDFKGKSGEGHGSPYDININLSPAMITKIKKQYFMNRKKQQLMNQKRTTQQRIRQHEAAQAAKQKITPTYTGPVTHDFDPKQDTGRRPDKPGGFLDPGKGSYGPHKAQGGIVDLYRHGGF